ncbi:MAG: glycosyltransferase [Candidatus Delongbacteria bacterium]
MTDLLLLPEGWQRLLVPVVGAGILALLWARRRWLADLEDCRIRTQDSGGLADGDPAGGIRRSLFIVARNEAPRLPGLLQDLEGLLDQDGGLEILLADDQSSDDTRRLLQDFCDTQPRARLLERADIRGKAAWLRRAVPLGQGDLLLFSDADCRLSRHWSLALEELLNREGLEAAGGPVLLLPVTSGDRAARWQRLHWILLSGVGAALSARNAGSQRPTTPSLWGGNLAVRRRAVEALGGYAACSTGNRNEDLELTRRLAQAGQPVALRLWPRALRVRTHPVDWAGSARQLARWAAGLGRLSPGPRLLALAVPLWLGALLLVLLLKPLLGLLLLLMAGQALGALLSGLAACLEEEGAGPGESAEYLLLLPALGLLAAWAFASGGARRGSRA